MVTKKPVKLSGKGGPVKAPFSAFAFPHDVENSLYRTSKRPLGDATIPFILITSKKACPFWIISLHALAP
jgi:hypothetical protein